MKLINNWIKRNPARDPFILDDITNQIADIRGVDVNDHLNPSPDHMHSPYLLNNIEIVAQRIKQAIDNGEKIGISYDIDTDGITAGTTTYRYLKYFTDNLVYIYHQRKDGHGISVQQIPIDINLLIVVDSSSNETKKCKELSEQGIDILILDHHPSFKNNPYAIIVNPQMDNYPNKNLSGVGVVFKCIEVLDNLFETFYSYEFIDLCAIGIQGDTMSMSEAENRFILYQGLHNIKNPGIKAILKKAGVFDIDSQTISYKLAPIINSCARTNQIEKIIELLLEDDFDKCLILAKECISLNEDRKKTQAKLFTKVKNRIDLSHKIIIVETNEKDKIDKGYQGLLAMNIADHYGKPTLVVKNHEEVCAGSGRGIGNIKLKELLLESKLFEYAEGHSSAFGCQFKKQYLNDILNYADEIIEEEQQEQKTILYDLELDKDDINYDLIKKIQQYNYITGKNCESTKFVIRNLTIEEIKVIGKMLDTVKIKTEILDCIKFKVNELWADALDVGCLIDVIGSLNINKWYNFGTKSWIENLQMLIEDYKFSEINV